MANEIKSARDALESISAWAEANLRDYGDDWRLHNRLCDMLKAALAMPRRNCEVGTEQEQQDRFREFCRHYESEGECGIGRYEAACPAFQGGRNPDCSLWWANMPYEAAQTGGAK